MESMPRWVRQQKAAEDSCNIRQARLQLPLDVVGSLGLGPIRKLAIKNTAQLHLKKKRLQMIFSNGKEINVYKFPIPLGNVNYLSCIRSSDQMSCQYFCENSSLYSERGSTHTSAKVCESFVCSSQL